MAMVAIPKTVTDTINQLRTVEHPGTEVMALSKPRNSTGRWFVAFADDNGIVVAEYYIQESDGDFMMVD